MPTITLSRPLQGQTVTVLATGKNAKIALEFSTGDVSLSRDADSLIFTFEDGAAIRIDDFYTSYHTANIPEFEVAGKIVSGTEFFSALGPDLIPAAGPATVARTARSSDHGAVSDLASGVDHLDGADITVEGSAFQTGSLLFDSSAASLAGAAGSGAAGPGAAAETPFFPAGPFVRAVLYSPGATGDAVTANVFFGANGAAPAAIATGDADFDGTNAAAPYAVSVSLPAGWSSSWVDVSFNSLSGRLEFRLTADGVAEMQRLGLTGESLVDFIHITVTDRASGDSFEYNVELVATDNQNFDSAAHDSRYGGQHLDNIGEFHQGQNNGGAYSVVSSSQNDEIIINETVIGGSSIHASGSVDPAQMADDYNTINLAAGVVNTTLGSTTHITSADGRLDVSGGVSASGAGLGNGSVENIVDMGKGTVHIQNTDPYATGVGAWVGGKNTISGSEVDINADMDGIIGYGSGTNIVSVTDGDLNVTSAQGSGISAIHGSANTITVENGSVYIDAAGSGIGSAYKDVVQGVFTGPGSTNSIVTKGGSVTINAGSAGISAGPDSSNSVSTNGGDITISTTSAYTAAVGAGGGGGSNTIDAGADGNVTITNTSSGTGSYGETGTGMAAGVPDFPGSSGSNSIITGSGTVTISGSITGPGSLSQTSPIMGQGMAAYDGSNRVETTDGNVTVSGSYTGANNPSGGTRWGAGYGMYAATDGSNDITTESGDVTVTGTRDGLGAGRGSGMVAVGGSNSITTKDGNVATSGTGSNAGTGYGMSATSSGSNSIVTESGSVNASGNIGMLASGSLSSNSITTKSGNVNVAGSGIANAYGSGMDAGSSGSNTIITESGNVTVTSNGAAGSSGMSVSSSGSNEIKTANGAVTVTAKSDTGAPVTGLSANNSGSNSITTDSGKVAVTGESRDGSGTGMSANNYGSNSITTDSGKVIVAGESTNGSGTGMHAQKNGSKNTISTAAGDVTVTGSGENGDGMYAQTSGSNAVTTTSGDVKVSGNSASGDGIGMRAESSGSNKIETVDGKVIVAGESTGGSGTGMKATVSGSNSIVTENGAVTVTGEGSYGWGMYAQSSGSNSINTTGKGNVVISAAGVAGAANAMVGNNTITTESGNVVATATGTTDSTVMFANSSGSNTITSGSGDVDLTATGTASYGQVMSARDGGSNSIETDSGNVTITGASDNGYGTGMLSYAYGSNSITTKSGSVSVSATGKGTGGNINSTSGMYSYSSGSNTITTESGDVTVTGTGSNIYGGYGMMSSASNSITTGSGNVTVTGEGSSGPGYGMYANSSGKNTITTKTGDVEVTGTGTSGSYGMTAESSGSNSIKTESGSVAVTGTNSGMLAKSSGSNKIETVGGNVTITSNNAANTDSAVQANGNGSANSIDAGTAGKVSISGGKYGLNAVAGGENSVNGGDISITSICPGTDVWNTEVAVWANGSGSTNTVDAGAGGKITVSGGRHSLEASSAGENKVSGGNITITNTSNNAVLAHGTGSTNTIDGGSDGNVAIKGGNYVVHASSGGENKISGSDITISEGSAVTNTTTSNTAQSERIVFAGGQGAKNTIDAGPDGKIAISGKWTVGAGSGGTNDIRGGDITITSGASTSSPTVWANGNGSANIIDAGPDGKVTIESYYESLNAYNSGSNTVKGGDITLTASHSWALWANGTGTSNTVDAGPGGKVTINGTSAGLIARGGINSVTGGEVAINTVNSSALNADHGQNIVTGDEIAISTVNGSALNAYYGQNIVKGNDITVTAKYAGLNASGSGGENTIEAGPGKVSIKGATGIAASEEGKNSVIGEDITIIGSIGLQAGYQNPNLVHGGTNTVSANGKVSVEALSIGLKAEAAGSNTITTTSGKVSISARDGLAADGSGQNTITTHNGSIEVKGNGSGTGASASDGGSNTITATSGTVDIINNSAGLVAQSGGINTISAADGKISVDATNTGLKAQGAGSSNVITGKDIDITAQTSSSNGLLAEAGGKNSVTGTGGNVALAGGNVLHATGSNSENRLSVHNGSIDLTSWSGKTNWSPSNSLLYYDDRAAYATGGGSNVILGTGGTNISFTGKGFGLRADSGGSNYVQTDGDVTFSGITTALSAIGIQNALASTNTLAADNIVIDSKVYADRPVAAVNAEAGGQNTLAASSGGAITITTSAATGNERDPHSTSINDTASVRADGAGSHNTLTADAISLDNQCGKGLAATNGGVNTLESAQGSPLTVTITASADAAEKAIAMWADGGGSVNYITGHSQTGGTGDSITLTANNGQGIAMQAENGGRNIITTGAGNDIVTLNGDMAIKNVANDGMQNKIETGLGNDVVRVSGSMIADRDSGRNIINVGAGDNLVEIGGDMRGVGTNSLILGSGDNTVNLNGRMDASGIKGVNSIQGDASGNTVVNVTGRNTVLQATGGGKNSISGVHDVHTNSGYIYAGGSDSSNRIEATGNVNIDTVNSSTLHAASGGKNTITGEEITITAHNFSQSVNIVHAESTDSKNSIVAGNGSGKVLITSGGSGIAALSGGENTIKGSDIVIDAKNGIGVYGFNGKNTVDAGATGNVTIKGKTSGVDATFSTGENVIKGGTVNIAGERAMNSLGGNNIVDAATVIIEGGKWGMYAQDKNGSNTIQSSNSPLTATITAATDTFDSAVAMNASGWANGQNAGSNYITGHSGTGGSGDNITLDAIANGSGKAFGMSAENAAKNVIEGSSLTVTITASANAAEKAIAMWADGGGSVNRITGHSQVGGTGDSITLTANNGQGIAMQTKNGGKNIITTGAGDDSVTINGSISGNGNEINLGGGSNVLTINGAVQSGSLNVTVDGSGTYTLVLQADTPADFVAHYGAWLTGIVSSNLIDGLSEVVFYGLDEDDRPFAETSFENLLTTLDNAGVDYSFQPPEIAPQGYSPSPFSFAMPAETGAEHHTQDAQHAAGHDDMQDSPLADHDGPALMTDHMTGDSPETIFSAQPGNTAHAEVPGADALGADTLDDATALAHFSEDADGQAQPLFAFLSDPADMSPGTPADMLTDLPDLPDLPDLFEEGDDALHNGYLGNEGGDGSDFAELYTPVTLTYGDESLDSLFAATDGQDTEQDGTGLFGETGLHDMGLTNMNAALDQSHLAGPAAPDASGAPAGPAVTAAESAAAATSEISSIPSVADSCQEATDNAAREMTNC